VTRRDAWLVVTAVAYCVCHHLGSVPDGFADAGWGTTVADWLDLLVPFAVLLPALAALVAARVPRATYVWFGVGSWLYTTGHGIHLAANSIGNAAPGRTAHLWDEDVGHWIWYAGVAVVFATLATTLVGRAMPGSSLRQFLARLLALAVGLTWGSNAVGGHFWVAGLALCVVAIIWTLRQRDGLPVLVAVVAVGGLAGLTLAGLLG
jgi:hypothetical protein